MAGKGKCFPRRHMPPAIDSFYWFSLNRYRKFGVLQRDDRAFARDYCVGKNTVTAWVKFLEREGWWIPRQETRTRNPKTGMFESVAYDVIEHDDWVLTHPGTCTYLTGPVPMNGTGKPHKSAKKTASALDASKLAQEKAAKKRTGKPASPDERDRSSPDQRISPVPTNGTYVVKESSRVRIVEKTKHDTEAFAASGSAIQEFDDSSPSTMEKIDTQPQPNQKIFPPSKERQVRIPLPAGAQVRHHSDANLHGGRTPEEVLLTAARLLARKYGQIGPGLAAAIAATCLNNPEGNGELPESTSYYKRTVLDKYVPEDDVPYTGNLEGFYFDGIAEDGIERLHRAAENRQIDLDDVIDRLESLSMSVGGQAA